LATVLMAGGDYTGAAPLVAEAAELLERIHGQDSLALVPVMRLQADLDYRKGDMEAERRNLARQVHLVRSHIPGDHWWKALALAEHGWVLARDGDLEGGRAALTEAIGIYERLDSPMVVEATRRAGQVEQHHGQLDAARAGF